MNFKKLLLLFSVLALSIALLCGCGAEEETQETAQTSESNENAPTDNFSKETNPVATIKMKDGGVITVELYPEVAPNTVNNFISLANKGFYNGVIFHRVIPGFMIQGGDPDGVGTGGPGYSIKGEFTNNGFTNNLKHTRGVISMARSQMPDTAGSQFFIMVADYPSLDNEYASFGMVTSGIEVADKIVSVERDSNDKPLADQTIESITVDTKGVEYKEPEIIKD